MSDQPILLEKVRADLHLSSDRIGREGTLCDWM